MMGDPFELAGKREPILGTVVIPWLQIVFVPIYIEGDQRWRSPVFGNPWTLPEWPTNTPYVGDPPPGMWRIT